MNNNEQINRLLDAYKVSRYNYWNALLTFNAILITVFSAIAIFNQDDRIIAISTLILVGLSLSSSFCLIRNYRMTKNKSLFSGLIVYHNLEITDEQAKKEIALSELECEKVNKYENWTEYFVFAEFILIILILLYNFFTPTTYFSPKDNSFNFRHECCTGKCLPCSNIYSQ